MATKECPNCGRNMIERTSQTQPLIYPPVTQIDWFCGGCGYGENSRTIQHESPEEESMRLWRQANP